MSGDVTQPQQAETGAGRHEKGTKTTHKVIFASTRWLLQQYSDDCGIICGENENKHGSASTELCALT